MSKVYGLTAMGFSNMSSLWNAGFADFCLLPSSDPSVLTNSTPSQDFINQCNSIGASPIYQNSDSGSGGCSSDCYNYYARLAGMGLQAVGGESQSGAEDAAVMNSLIFYNMGGEGTGGASGNNDIFGGWEHASVTGHGCASYLETYTSSSMISADAMGVAARANQDAGCKEVGLLIGSWCSRDYGANASTYAAMCDAFANHGVNCAGFMYWYVTGDSGGFGELGMMQQLMSWYPPIKASIKARFAGGGSSTAAAVPLTVAQLYSGSTPATCALGSGEVVVFVRGTTGNVYMKAYFDSAWHNWDDLEGVAGGGTGPGAASWGGQRVDLFVGGTGGAVWHKGGTVPPYGAWENLGGVTTSDCAACSTGNNDVYVFVRGSDGALWYRGYYEGAWHPWYNLGGQILPGTGPAACSWGGGELDVFVTGMNNSVYHLRYHGSWDAWQNMGGVTSCTPGCATPGSGAMALFARGQNGALYWRALGGTTWGNWQELGGNIAAGTGPGACYTLGKYQVFVAGTTNNIYHTTGNGSWTAWEDIGGAVTVPATSAEAAGGTGLISGGSSANVSAVIKIALKESTAYVYSAPVGTTLTITGQAGNVDSNGNWIAGQPYTGLLWKWSKQYPTNALTDMGQFSPAKDGSFSYTITDSVAEEMHYNVGFVASEVNVGGTTVVVTPAKAGTTTTVPGKTTTTPASWSKCTIVTMAGCEYCAQLEADLNNQGIPYNNTENNANYGFPSFPGVVLCDGTKVNSPGGDVESNAEYLIGKIKASCYHAATSTTTKSTTTTTPGTAAVTKTVGGMEEPSKWGAQEIVITWTAAGTPVTPVTPVTPTTPTISQTPTDYQPSDVSLTPVLPIPPPVATGVTVVLRDRKKSTSQR